MNSIDVLMQSLHLSSMALAVGGIFTLRFVGCPALKSSLDDAGRRQALAAIVGRFKFVVHGAISGLLVSGGWLLWRSWPMAQASMAYRHALTLKILLALVIFFLSIALTMSGEEPNRFQKARDKWLAINFALALIVIALGAFLRRL